MKILKPEFQRKDDRGSLTQVITDNFKQLNVLEIAKGEKFGNHYHKIKHEVFYIISGRILLKIDQNDWIMMNEGTAFLIEPGDRHTIEAIRNTVIAETLSHPYDKGDTYE